MIEPKKFYHNLVEHEFDFFAGVPDSLLKELCLCIQEQCDGKRHIISANEGNAIAMAAGYHVATGKYGVVYMQNSGQGNAVNPLLSLTDEAVYEIPMLLIIGYRGEPGKKDEPQHAKQGILTLPILETLGMEYQILTDHFEEQIAYCRQYVEREKKTIALVVKKDSFETYQGEAVATSVTKVNEGKECRIQKPESPHSSYELTRERALEIILEHAGEEDFFVSTTGKSSREIYEIRERRKEGHDRDFLTVGSMGHASSLALGMSLFSNKTLYCIDGDGAFIMHMGGLAVAIQNAGKNFKYILINNGCHESVGGQPTIAGQLDMVSVLTGFGFRKVLEATNENQICEGMEWLQKEEKCAMVVMTNALSRKDLGRPAEAPKDNKEAFQRRLRSNEGTDI